jgi:hypothetical protein
MDAWDKALLIACIVIFVACVLTVVISRIDARKPKQVDWVAHRHREIRKAGEKTRMHNSLRG